tara:strand:- start:406 stop:645 length:240 start_codon:yes stop_codon:yes gene_type:complete
MKLVQGRVPFIQTPEQSKLVQGRVPFIRTPQPQKQEAAAAAPSAGGPSNLASFSKIAKASIASINGIALASIASINSVS